jgi:hypothetical protein
LKLFRNFEKRNCLLKEQTFKIKEKAKVSPKLTGLENWIEGVIIKIFKNPFLGDEIAIRDSKGRIFFGEKKYFEKA